AVAGAAHEVSAAAGCLDHVPRAAVDVPTESARGDGMHTRRLSLAHDLEQLTLPRIGLGAGDERARDVGAIASDRGADVDDHEVACGDLSVVGGAVRKR